MRGNIQGKPTVSVKQIIDQILISGQITRKEHILLTSAILSDRQITEEDRRQINHIFDSLQLGRLKLVELDL